IFASPVHFVNAKGAWEEIDNRLIEKTDSKGRRRFETKAGPFRARFFEDADGGSLASLSSGDTEFSWSYPGANISKPAHTKKALRRKFDSELSRRMKVTDRLSDDVTYESLFPGMSVRLTADDLGVKEDIILENKAALRHAVLQLPAEFDYVKNADESVSVLKGGEEKLRIDAPFTYDANMASLPTVVSLTRAESGVLLRYEINESDLENAAFPVTIDPRVSFSGTHSNIQTAQICNRNKAENFSTTRYPASGTSTTSPAYTYMTLIKFGELMNKKASDTILSAELNVKVSGSQGLTGNLNAVEYVGAYEIKAPWEVNSVTWNSVDADNHTILDDNLISFISSTNVTYAKFDITDLYNKWYLPGDDGSSRSFGVVLRKPVGIANQNYVTFYSHLVTGHEPFVVINYLSHAGVKDWWTYDSMSAGRAGSANIDLFNGNLVVHHADSSTIGSRMPVSVKHIYNSCQSLTDDFGCGLGWRTNFNQIVRQETVANDTYYVWQDGEGTDHFFKVTTSQPYSDSEGMQLKMHLTDNSLTITDKGDTVMTFEKTGETYRLLTVTDPHGNTMTLFYNEGGKLIKAEDGMRAENTPGRMTTFAYNDNGLLSSIAAPGCPVVQYVYASVSGGYNLHKVNYADLTVNQFTEYTYEGSMLTSMKNFDGCELALSY
ncbi:MAG: DNRLRE domain-containing protein, partial [Clostridia bacterium]|nr:DNRLRE domain-containing protein [Clostridia bacterium]